MPIPYVTSAEAGWDRGLLEPEQAAAGAAHGIRAVARRRPRSRAGRLRHLPESVGVQRADGVRAQPAVLLHATGGRPDDAARAVVSDTQHPRQRSDRRRRAHASWITTTRSNTRRRGAAACSTELLPSTMVEAAYMGSWTLGADNATIRNVPEPGPGSIQSRRPIPALGPIRTIRFDGKSIYHGLTLKAEQRLQQRLFLLGELHAVVVDRRRLEPGSDGSRDERAAGRAQRVRRDRRVGRVELRPSSSVRRQRHISAAVLPGCGRPEGRRARRVARQRRLLRAVRRAVHRESRRRPGQHRQRTGAAAGPTDEIRICHQASGDPIAGSIRQRLRCRRPTRLAARRGTA